MPLDGADVSVTTLLDGVVELQWRLGARICKGAHYPPGVSTEPVAELIGRAALDCVCATICNSNMPEQQQALLCPGYGTHVLSSGHDDVTKVRATMAAKTAAAVSGVTFVAAAGAASASILAGEFELAVFANTALAAGEAVNQIEVTTADAQLFAEATAFCKKWKYRSNAMTAATAGLDVVLASVTDCSGLTSALVAYASGAIDTGFTAVLATHKTPEGDIRAAAVYSACALKNAGMIAVTNLVKAVKGTVCALKPGGVVAEGPARERLVSQLVQEGVIQSGQSCVDVYISLQLGDSCSSTDYVRRLSASECLRTHIHASTGRCTVTVMYRGPVVMLGAPDDSIPYAGPGDSGALMFTLASNHSVLLLATPVDVVYR